MTRIPLLLLIFFTIVANAENKMIEFIFSGEFICHRDFFRYHLSLLEDDPFFDNYISHMPGTSSYAVRAINNQTFVHNFEVKGEENNDGCTIPLLDLICNYTFELWMKVIHDCTTDGSKHLAWYKLGDYYAFEGNVTDTFNFNLTNAGDPTKDVIGTKKFERKQHEIHDYFG